jgi:hypothetical protein
VAEIMAQGCGGAWGRCLALLDLARLTELVFGGIRLRLMRGAPNQKPALLPGFRSLFLDFETKLCFWTQGLEANRFFTVGAGKRQE